MRGRHPATRARDSCWGEAVEINRIGYRIEARGLFDGVAENELEDAPPAIQFDSVFAGNQWWPAFAQHGRQLGKLTPRRVGNRQVGRRKRMFLDRNKLESTAALRIVAPNQPGGHEIQSQAEAGFENGK